MASGNGSWSPTTGSGNRGRLTWQIDQSPSSVGSGTSSVSLRLRVWYESRYSVSDSSNSYTISGAWSGSGSRSISHGGSGGRTVLYDGTITVSTSYAGTVKRSFSASFSGINATPNIPSVSGSHTVAKRPNRAPNPPTWGSTTRVGTDKCTITWSNNPTSAGPITRNEVQYWSSVNQDWRVNSNNVSATATSYTAQNLGTNREYRYRVRAVGPGGRSAWVTGGTIATPPSAPVNVSAQKLSGGAIRVNGTDTAGPTNRTRTFLIYDSPDGGAEVLVGTAGSLPWTFADPDPSVTHSFRIRTRINSQGEMLSPFSARTNTVQLLAPPNAPTLLEPVGVRDNSDAGVRFRWQHNPVDTTDQTAYELRYRRVGDTTWGTVTGSVAQSRLMIFLGTVGEFEWQVRTKGEHADWSPWSPVARFLLASKPTVAITTPEGGTLDQSRVELEIGYNQDEGSPQARVEAELTHQNTVIETLTWAGARATGRFRTPLEDNTTYTVRVRVQAGNGLWSDWDEVTFTTDFPVPVAFEVIAVWDKTTGAVTLEGAPLEGSPDELPAESLTYQRRDTTDSPWVTLIEDADPGTTVTDPTPMLVAPEYRIISHTTLPSANTGPVLVAERPGGLWPVFLNTGPGFTQVAALYDNTRYSPNTERGKTRHKRAGRAFPVTKWGRHRDHTYTLSATVNPNSPGATVADVQALEDEPYVACYRDVLGHKHFVTIDNVSADVERNGWWNVSVPMTREDFDENNVGVEGPGGVFGYGFGPYGRFSYGGGR